MVDKKSKAYIFDLDGTLLDRPSSLERFLPSQYERFSEHFSSISFDQFRVRFLELDNNGYVWKDKVYQTLEEEFDLHKGIWMELLEDYVKKFSEDSLVFEDTHEMLRSLKSSGMKLGMITNGIGDFQWRNIQMLKLHPYFDTILVSEWEGLKKPDRRIFDKALSNLDVTAEESLFIGDHEDKDILGAKSVGMKTVLIDHNGVVAHSHADYVVHSCKELLAL